MILPILSDTQECIKGILVNIQTNQSTLKNQLDVLVSSLQSSEVLSTINNKELSELVEFIKDSSAAIGVEYNLDLVPLPKPLEFKTALHDKSTPIGEVYKKIQKLSIADLSVFSALYLLNESLWNDHWEADDSIESITSLISVAKLTTKELQIFQDALDEYNLDIDIVGKSAS